MESDDYYINTTPRRTQISERAATDEETSAREIKLSPHRRYSTIIHM